MQLRRAFALCSGLLFWPQAVPADTSSSDKQRKVEVVLIRAGENIQAVVNASPGGTLFRLGVGVHRMQQIVVRSFDRFLGEPGAVLNGSRLITEFRRAEDLWFADGQTQQGQPDGFCRDTSDGREYRGCRFPEDLYLDDEPLRRVEGRGEVISGAWFFDYATDRVYLADDPTGRKVEIGVSPFALRGGGRDVEIRGLIIEKYANPSQKGAVHAAGPQGRLAEGWVVEGNEIRLNHGAGVFVGDSMTVRGNRILSNGQIGLVGGGVGSLVEDNEIAGNNYAGFSPGWEAGGAKFFLSRDLVIQGNFVHHNDGTGLWTDIDSVGVIYEHNVVADNTYRGIQHEISFDATIRDNVVERNGLASDEWLWGAQILIQNSRNVEAHDNRVVVAGAGGDGIVLIQQDRGVGPLGPYLTRYNIVHHNHITHLGERGQSGAVADFRERDMLRSNRFQSNAYYVADPNVPFWAWGEPVTWGEFRDAGQESGGSVNPTR